jgi:hypothetical protein
MNFFSRNKWNEFILMGEKYPGLAFCCGSPKKIKLLAQSSTNWLASVE